MPLNVDLLVIDPQNSFMDQPGSALPVPGATDDMKRVAKLVKRTGRHLRDIRVTLDSHRKIDIAHPSFWENASKVHPDPFTIITSADIKSGLWTPRHPQAKPDELDGRTILEYVIYYAEQLEQGGKYPLLVWPEHCIIGSNGHNIQEDLLEALLEWEDREFANVTYITKGANVWTEHFGGLQAEVPMSSDPSSGLNTDFLEALASADIIAVAGEALSHCVRSTVTQIADNIGDQHIGKFHILTDCTSPVPQIGDGPDFPAIAQNWLKQMQARGMVLTTSEQFLA